MRRNSVGARYIGVLGSGTDLAALTAWAKQYPEGAEMSVPTPPGLCVNDGPGADG